MMKFQSGDVVRIKQGTRYWGQFAGEGTIRSVTPDASLPYSVRARSYTNNYGDDDLVLVRREVSMDKAKFGIKYDRQLDPVEFYETRKAAEARITELLDDAEVKKTTMYLFAIGEKWKVERPITFSFVPVK